MNYMEAAKLIKDYRTDIGYSEQDYANLCGISNNTLRRIEKGLPVQTDILEKALKPTGKKLEITDNQ